MNNLLRLKKDVSKLRKVLGKQLFFEWMYHTGIITFKEYKSVRVQALHPNIIEIECD